MNILRRLLIALFSVQSAIFLFAPMGTNEIAQRIGSDPGSRVRLLFAVGHAIAVIAAALCTAILLAERSSWARKSGIATALLSLPILPFGSAFCALGLLGLHFYTGNEVGLARAPSCQPVDGDGTQRLLNALAGWGAFVVYVLLLNASFAWATRHGLSLSRATIPWYLALALALVLSTLLHELGHAAAGWAAGFKLDQFRVGPLHWLRLEGRSSFHLNWSWNGATGMVGCAPTRASTIRRGLIFLTALGPIANLLTAAVAALLLLLSPGSPWAGYWVTLAMLASVSFASGIANFIPSRGSEHYSDGAQIWQMALKGPWCDYRTFREFQALSKTTPQSPADWPEASVVMTADFPDTPASRVENLVAASLHFRMKGNLERAGVYISQAGELLSTLSQARKDLLGPEIAMFEAVYRQDFATAAIWLKESSRWSLSGSRLARAALAAHENRLDEGRLAWETAWSRIVSSPPTGVRIAREQAAEHVARRWYPEFLARVERERCGGPEPELLTCMAASTILQSGGSTL